MLSVVNYTYSRRLLLNSSLNINYRGYLLIDKNSSSSILDLPDFGELVPIYEVLLFCLDRYFSSACCRGQVIDITNSNSDDLLMLINYIKYHCGNRRLFILYRPHDVDPVEVAKLYDISLDFGITQMTDSELNLHKEDYPLAFKSTRDNAYAYDLSGDAFIPSSNNFFASVMLIKPKGEDFGFTAVHFKVIDSSIVRTSSEVVKFFFEFIKRRNIPLLLANIHPVFENPIAFVKECLATLERD